MDESSEAIEASTVQKHNINLSESNILAELNAQDMSPAKKSRKNDDSSDDEAVPTQRIRKRLQQFSDSDTEKENVRTNNGNKDDDPNHISTSDSDSDHTPFKSVLKKSRIQMDDSSSDSDTPKDLETVKNEEQQLRMKNKKNKIQQKFKSLVSARSKSTPSQNLSDIQSSEDDKSAKSGCESSDNEMSSIAKIKQKIKKSMASMSSLCDPDTSDEESNMNNKIVPKQRQKKAQKSTKMIEAKPQRMSAKQAMENMQLIKSESNRMLREKSVSLPYHRPKALLLKDIMARRKPAVSSDGKALPIKMNEEQLRQYAQQLQERQKEMMELCKSESDEDSAPEPEKNPEKNPGEGPEKPTEEASIPNESETQVHSPNNLEITNSETVDSETNLLTTDSELKETNTDVNMESENADENKMSKTTDNNDSEQSNHIQEDTDKTHFDEPNSTEIDLNTNNHNSVKPNDSIDSQNNSNTDIKLVYNDDSIEEENVTLNNEESNVTKAAEDVSIDSEQQKISSEPDSQLISLQYTETNTEETTVEPNLQNNSPKADSEPEQNSETVNIPNDSSEQMEVADDERIDDFFSDDDVNMDDIDKIIENAEIMKNDLENVSSPMLIKDPLTIKPKLTGAPGMVIDLDGSNPIMAKRSGVELLKERFTYFAKLKTPEEMEREKERRVKPGAQHLLLKQKLEEEIAEQRSVEWAKRLEDEKQLHEEMDAILDDGEEADDSIEKIKANLDKEDNTEENNSESDAEEEELVEDDVEMKDKPMKHNPMLDEEAEESDVEENDEATELKDAESNADGDNDDEDGEDDEDSSEEEESSESEAEETSKPKKGRILKAFEDSDDEEAKVDETDSVVELATDNNKDSGSAVQSQTNTVEPLASSCEVATASQDDVIQLAQRYKSASDDIFTSQENSNPGVSAKEVASDELLGTQSFSISSAKPTDFMCPSQPYHDPNLNGITDNLSENVISSQLPTQSSQSQPIGEDILALCTGNFYDNEFVSQTNANEPTVSIPKDAYIDDAIVNKDTERTAANQDKAVSLDNTSLPKPETDINNISLNTDASSNKNIEETEKPKETSPNTDAINKNIEVTEKPKEKKIDDGHLKSILDELDDPEFDNPKPNKFFTGGTQRIEVDSSQLKKRFVIDSDDENCEPVNEGKKKKNLKKKKLEQRALQISDDEEEEGDEGFGIEDDDVSDLEEGGERVVEYDSEENEIEVQPDKAKKKRKAADFLEQEAELTSEDEWVGSGDEDERDLDKMEREEGDDDVFHQGKLRKELGQIHMRDVLDQDKREVRLLQELLFEDGDLGGGHRQRKFRWRHDGDEQAGTVPDEFADTQEEEFESEEQWRKQRHEREVFLKQMQQEGNSEENMNITVNRNTIIKANLSSKSMSALLMEVNQSKVETVDSPVVEKKVVKDIPSPKKSFSIFQQNYHGSILTRGRGALARLAALATPLAADDDAPNIGSLAPHKRNFVFAALTPDKEDKEKPKVTIKRKADVNIGTPKLVKKMRIEEQQKPKSSLLDHLNL